MFCYKCWTIFIAKFSKINLLKFANTYKNHIVSKEFCIAHHDTVMCFLPIWTYHISVLREVGVLLQKLDLVWYLFQQADCLNAPFKYRLSGNIDVKSRQMCDNMQKAACFNQRKRRVDRMPSIAQKWLLKKKYGKLLLSSFQKTKSARSSGSVLAERFELFKETN